MEKNIYLLTMNWSEPDLVETFSLFKQRMNLYFNVQNIKNEKNWIQSYYLLDYQDYEFIILGHCLDPKTQSKTCGINLKITSSYRAINGWQDSIYSEPGRDRKNPWIVLCHE